MPTSPLEPLSDRSSALSLLNFADEHLLQQIVQEPTRGGKNILDLVFTNSSELVHSVSVSKTLKSDHDSVEFFLLHPEFLLRPPVKPEFSPTSTFDDINFNSANWESIRVDLLKVDWNPIVSVSSSDQDKAWRQFEDIIAGVCSKHAPLHSTNVALSNKSKGIPRKRQLLLRRKRRLNIKINSVKYGQTRLSNKAKLSRLQDERAKVELAIKSDLKDEREKEELDALSKIKVNPKAFYTFAKKNSSYKAPIGPLLDESGQLRSDPMDMANILQRQYQTAFSDPHNGKGDSFEEKPPITEEKLLDVKVTPADVIDAIAELNRSSAPGPDKFPSVILAECKEILADPISRMWQNSMDTGQIADLFKLQCITPVFKKGSKAIAANYRPVSLTSHLIKIFERVIRKQTVTYIEGNKLFSLNQHGFRSGRNCLTQLLHHVDDILNDLSTDANADVIYLDFSKAFDKVDHKILLKKLSSFGIGGNLLRWINSFLSGRKQYVVVQRLESGTIIVLSGVPQGTVLGPLLFLLYINDMEEVVKHCLLKIFADDSKLHKKIRSHLDRLLLQQDLESVFTWASENNMDLNQDKFELLQLGRNPDLKHPYTLPSGQELLGSIELC